MFCLENNYVSFKNTSYKNIKKHPQDKISGLPGEYCSSLFNQKVNILNSCYIFCAQQVNQTLFKKNSTKNFKLKT